MSVADLGAEARAGARRAMRLGAAAVAVLAVLAAVFAFVPVRSASVVEGVVMAVDSAGGERALSVTARIPAGDALQVAPGQRATIRFPGDSAFGVEVTGTVDHVSALQPPQPGAPPPPFVAEVSSTAPPQIADRLVPGIPVSVSLQRGDVTLAAYLLRPLLGSFTGAGTAR